MPRTERGQRRTCLVGRPCNLLRPAFNDCSGELGVLQLIDTMNARVVVSQNIYCATLASVEILPTSHSTQVEPPSLFFPGTHRVHRVSLTVVHADVSASPGRHFLHCWQATWPTPESFPASQALLMPALHSDPASPGSPRSLFPVNEVRIRRE